MRADGHVFAWACGAAVAAAATGQRQPQDAPPEEDEGSHGAMWVFLGLMPLACCLAVMVRCLVRRVVARGCPGPLPLLDASKQHEQRPGPYDALGQDTEGVEFGAKPRPRCADQMMGDMEGVEERPTLTPGMLGQVPLSTYVRQGTVAPSDSAVGLSPLAKLREQEKEKERQRTFRTAPSDQDMAANVSPLRSGSNTLDFGRTGSLAPRPGEALSVPLSPPKRRVSDSAALLSARASPQPSGERSRQASALHPVPSSLGDTMTSQLLDLLRGSPLQDRLSNTLGSLRTSAPSPDGDADAGDLNRHIASPPALLLKHDKDTVDVDALGDLATLL